MIYDVAIVGAGAAGLLAALELTKKSKLSVLLIEQVKRLHDSRNVSNGWFGGSAKSDVRIFEDQGFGGDVQNPILFKALMSHLTSHMKGKPKLIRGSLGKRELTHINSLGFSVYEPTTYILSSDKMIQIEKSVQKLLQSKIEIKSNCRIEKIDKSGSNFQLFTSENKVFTAKKCILALGRGGSQWAVNALSTLDIRGEATGFDLGIRLEFPEKALSEFSSSNFRVAFDDYRTSVFTCRGIVEMENVDDIKTSNIRNMSGKTTHNASCYLLKKFTSNTPLADVVRLVKIANVLADEQLLKEPVSRWLAGESVLAPVPEYAGLVAGLQKLLTLIPGAKRRGTVYAPEARINTCIFELTKDMESTVKGLYIVGDMSGHTNSFAQAGCSGIAAARHIVKTRSK